MPVKYINPTSELMHLDVSVVIVNWNTRDLLRQCIQSIYDQTRNILFELIVIDNASRDDSITMLREEFPNIKLIVNCQNRGFAAANNQGIAVANGRYILLLNPDTIILENAIEKAINFADKHHDVAVTGCRVYINDFTVQQTCFSFPSLINIVWRITGLQKLFPRSRIFSRGVIGWWDRDTEREVDVVSGMFMLVRCEAIKHVGMMDERYFVYAEEADWCYRFWKAGWRCIFTPNAKIIHLDGGSKSTQQDAAKMYTQYQKSVLQFYRTCYGRKFYAFARLLFVLSAFVRLSVSATYVLICPSNEIKEKVQQYKAVLQFLLTGHQPKQ